MSGELFTKTLVTLLFSGVFAWVILDRDPDAAGPDSTRQRYLPYVSGALLPACLLALLVMGLVLLGARQAVRLILSFCFGVFLHICVYDLLLLPLLPLLRRRISARACAVLWMLPNYLYLTQMSTMRLPAPRWVVVAPSGLVRALLIIWLAGFAAVLGGRVCSHLVFRARILRQAAPVTDPEVLAVWQREVEAARFCRPKFRLVTSPALQTPLSVGLIPRAVRVVLPQRDDSAEELSLIFRHELVHIGRKDAWNKFFLVFCAAICWFDPLLWVAARRSAEDLELSCDETVLLGADELIRRRYAELLLRTAGEERGFTTCLSASARALRYRLKSVLAAKRKPSGALLVGLVFFLLCMSCGSVALAWGETTGTETIYAFQPPEQYVLRSAETGDLVCTDEAALHRYLSALRLVSISGNYSFEPQGRSVSMLLDTPEGVLVLILSDRYLKFVPLYGEKPRVAYFYLPEGANWAALDEILVKRPARTMPLHGPPQTLALPDEPQFVRLHRMAQRLCGAFWLSIAARGQPVHAAPPRFPSRAVLPRNSLLTNMFYPGRI